MQATKTELQAAMKAISTMADSFNEFVVTTRSQGARQAVAAFAVSELGAKRTAVANKMEMGGDISIYFPPPKDSSYKDRLATVNRDCRYGRRIYVIHIHC